MAYGVRDIVHSNFARIDPANPRPYMDTENGPLGFWINNVGSIFPQDREYQKLLSWTNAASGAAGSGMRWPYPQYGFDGAMSLNSLSPAMEDDLAALAKVTSEVDWTRIDALPATTTQFSVDKQLFSTAVRDKEQMLGYIARDSRVEGAPTTGATVVGFDGFADRAHEVRWFDTATGELIRSDRVSGSAFEVATPSFDSDLAVVVRDA